MVQYTGQTNLEDTENPVKSGQVVGLGLVNQARLNINCHEKIMVVTMIKTLTTQSMGHYQ